MNFQSMIRSLSVVALCAAAAVIAGCATASKPEAMVPTTAIAGIQHAKTTSVVVAGGSETSALGKSQISNEAFQQAIAQSIEKNKTFSSVVKGAGGDYQLAVTVVNMDQPSFGFSFTVKMEAAWSLKKADGTVVMQEIIKSEGTAGATEAFAGTERLRLANEYAARNNIAAGLEKIGKLDF
jgi:Flp pilus assembly protein CpaB